MNLIWKLDQLHVVVHQEGWTNPLDEGRAQDAWEEEKGRETHTKEPPMDPLIVISNPPGQQRETHVHTSTRTHTRSQTHTRLLLERVREREREREVDSQS